MAFNTQQVLPKIIAVVVEDDIVKQLTKDRQLIRGTDLQDTYNRLVRNMISYFKRVRRTFKEGLPRKAKANRESWPHITFITPSLNKGFNPFNYEQRKLFGKAITQ